jgi:hypothetical protein
MDNKDIYFNFPIVLLQGAFENIRGAMGDIMDYAGFAHTLKLEYGSQQEKMLAAGEYFFIKFSPTSYTRGKELYDSIPENTPKAGIKKELCFDYYQNPKSCDDIVYLLAFLALKSMIGSKPYIKATNSYLVARMAGIASVQEKLTAPETKLDAFFTRRKFDKVKLELQLNWHVCIYSHYTRGFYVSFEEKFPLDKLVLEAEKHRATLKARQLQATKNAARENALKILTLKNK